MARPRKDVDVAAIARLRQEGLSWPENGHEMRLGIATVYRAHKAIASDPFQNAGKGTRRTSGAGTCQSGRTEALNAKVAARNLGPGISPDARIERAKRWLLLPAHVREAIQKANGIKTPRQANVSTLRLPVSRARGSGIHFEERKRICDNGQ
jgi:hypothetical protein